MINTQYATLRHSPTRPNQPHIRAPLQERRLGLKHGLGPVPGRKGRRRGPPGGAWGLGLSLAAFTGLFLLAVFGRGRSAGEVATSSLERDHKGVSEAAPTELAPPPTVTRGPTRQQPTGAPVFVAERIRDEHAQFRFENEPDMAVVRTPIEVVASATEPTTASTATETAQHIPDLIEEVPASPEPTLVIVGQHEEDHHDLAQAAEAEALDETVVERAESVLATEQAPQQEECEKSLTFKLANLHGLGSEVALLVRAAAVARAYGYKNLFIDDSNWNFGKWTDYFKPPPNNCLPPPARKLTTSMQLSREDRVALPRPPRYTRQSHIIWDTRDMDGLDETFASLFIDKAALSALQAHDRAKLRPAARPAQVALAGADAHGPPGAGEALVPAAFEEAFRVQRAVMKEVWRPNGVVRRMMEELRERMGLARVATEAGRAHGGVEEVVIAVHCRLGDKHKELGNLLPPSPTRRPNEVPGLHDELLAAFFAHAGRAVDRVLADGGLAPAPGQWAGQPKLALMSDDLGALEAFEAHARAGAWRVAGTEPEAADVWKGRGGFSETFHNKLPLKKRVVLARKFVRDLTLLGQASDGIVLTASSNVGRLMALLAGEEKAVVKGRVMSLDTRWFPLARFL